MFERVNLKKYQSNSRNISTFDSPIIREGYRHHTLILRSREKRENAKQEGCHSTGERCLPRSGSLDFRINCESL